MILAALASACCLPALAETYPVYIVSTHPAFLLETPELAGLDNAIYAVPHESLVLVAEEQDGWCLVYTQDELTGYMSADSLKPTGKSYQVDFMISADRIARNADIVMNFITIDPQAVLPDDSIIRTEYPATLRRGAPAYDLNSLLTSLLGEGYGMEDRSEYASDDVYFSQAEDKPARYLHVQDETRKIWYFDSMVTGERGGEYEPPDMNMTLDESLTLCKSLLNGVLPSDWLIHPGISRSMQNAGAMRIAR